MRELAWAIRVQRVNVSESYKQLGELSSGKGKGTAMARSSWYNYSLPLPLPPRSCACSVQPQFWAEGTEFKLQLLHWPPPFTMRRWKTPHHVFQHVLVSGLHVLILHGTAQAQQVPPCCHAGECDHSICGRGDTSSNERSCPQQQYTAWLGKQSGRDTAMALLPQTRSPTLLHTPMIYSLANRIFLCLFPQS